MKLLSEPECRAWCEGYGLALAEGEPRLESNRLKFRLPERGAGILALAKWLEASLWPRSEILIWVTLSRVWPSCENWHLFDGWRKGYGDLRLLHEAPGHVCQEYERPEVVTLLYLSMLFGWDCFALAPGASVDLYVSHDGYALLAAAKDAKWTHEIPDLLRMELMPQELPSSEPPAPAHD